MVAVVGRSRDPLSVPGTVKYSDEAGSGAADATDVAVMDDRDGGVRQSWGHQDKRRYRTLSESPQCVVAKIIRIVLFEPRRLSLYTRGQRPSSGGGKFDLSAVFVLECARRRFAGGSRAVQQGSEDVRVVPD